MYLWAASDWKLWKDKNKPFYLHIFVSEKGVVAIFGPLSKSSSEHIKSITDSMEIPYIETRWNYRSQKVIGLSMFYMYYIFFRKY